jgi:hypothetical protein
MRAKRIVFAAPAIAALGWLAVVAISSGTAGNVVFETSQKVDVVAARPSATMDEALDRFHEQVNAAYEIAPADPAARELLGVLDVRRAVVHGSQEYLAEADVHFVSALAARPTSAYTWVNYATARYAVGDTGPQFETALRRASILGPYEPEVQRDVALYGLAVWSEVALETRKAIDSMIANGVRRDPAQMLQIAQRRGRLDVACAHLAGVTRQTDRKWVQLCQSMEAIS